MTWRPTMPSANTTTTTTLATDLRRLGFNRTADELNDLIAQAARKRWSATVLLEHIAAAEIEDKQRRSVESRLTRARLGRFKPLADWDSQWPTALDRPALERILTLDFLARGENVILVGAQGCYGMTPCQHSCVRQHLWPLSAGSFGHQPKSGPARRRTIEGRFDDESRCYSVIITVARDSARMTVIRRESGPSWSRELGAASPSGSHSLVARSPDRASDHSSTRRPLSSRFAFRSVPGRKRAFGHISCSHRGGRRVTRRAVAKRRSRACAV